MIAKYSYFKGKIVPVERATVGVITPAYRYGSSVFEGIRAYWNEKMEQLYIFRSLEHCSRLFQSARLMQMKSISESQDQVFNKIKEVLQKNQIKEDCHIVPSFFIDEDGQISSVEPICLSIIVRLRGRLKGFSTGIKCCISSWIRISDNSMPPRIKCAANYQNSRLAALEAQINRYDNTIMLNCQGKVSEAPAGCIFIVKNGRFITPAVTNNILESITRDTVIDIGKNILGIIAEEREIDRTELYAADEVLICGTNYEILPVIQIDSYEINGSRVGQITSELQKEYMNIVRGDNNSYKEKWLTGVY